jgi:hypothetical protein
MINRTQINDKIAAPEAAGIRRVASRMNSTISGKSQADFRAGKKQLGRAIFQRNSNLIISIAV